MTTYPKRADWRNEIGTVIHKVGDVIETVEDLERLPEGTLLFSTQLHAYWMEKEGHFVAIGSDRWLVADEAASYGPFTIRWLPENGGHGMTTPCNPPPAPLAVGDLIETKEQAESLPVGTITVTVGNTAFRKVGIGGWQRVGGTDAPFADRFMAGDGDRIIYLPSGDSA